jgi:transglutaminase-like putative cysteine protease
MSSGAGPSTRDTTRTAIAVLTVLGFVFIAAVLPAVGSQAPGASLFPQDGGDGQAAPGGQAGGQSAMQELLGGQGGSSTGGANSLVDGLMNQLSQGDSATPGSGRQGRSGSGRSAFGALTPGSETGVGSRDNPLSKSLRNQSVIPHLVVESSRASYWRTGAYGVYTGSGWEARGEARESSFPLAVTGPRNGRQQMRQEVTLLRPATSLPAAWEVTNVGGLDSTDVRVTQRGGLQTTQPVPANTTYTAVSRAPSRDPERLRGASRNYPQLVEQRYTSLPDSTPDRVTTFTDELTSDADNPYETAVQIEQWLESNKEYSLQATHEGGDVAAQFIFEMERGYCEYFATSMVVMLRSQGIPARYTVGYSTGQPQGNDTYVVRAMNAHAWVEVYFPNTGWVRFDPTPGQSRLAQESRLFQQATSNESARQVANRFLDMADDGSGSYRPSGTDGGQSGQGSETGTDGTDAGENGSATNGTSQPNPYNHTEQGSPGESFDPSSGGSYSIELLTDPVPGQQVTVEVTRDTRPVEGAAVTFNGERVGVTNRSGIVTGEVPFARQLIVSVAGRPGDDGDGNATGAGLLAADTRALGPDGAGALAADGGTVTRQDNGTDGANTTRSFDVPTDINVSLSGTLDPGATVTVLTRIDGSPVADAAVLVDGQQAGTTGSGGRTQVQLPANETVFVEARRDVASGNRTVELADVNVSVSGFALPGLSVTVSVTDGGDPVEGATVAVVDGSTSATTGADGTATLSLPLSTGVSVRAVTPAGIAETAPVKLRFLTAGFGLFFAVVLVGGLVRLRRQATRAGQSLAAQLAATMRWLSGAFVSVLVGFGVWGERILGQLPALARGLVARVRGAVAALVAAIRAQDPGQLPNPVTLLRALVAWLLSAIRSAGAGVSGPIPTRDSDGRSDSTATMPEPGEPIQAGPSARERIRASWRDFRRRVPVSDYEHRTPGELSRKGVEVGHPEDSVRTLTDAFRAIEYGERDPHAFVDDAETASERIAFAAEQAGNYEDEPPTADEQDPADETGSESSEDADADEAVADGGDES